MEKLWLKQYPAGVPAEIDVNQYSSLVALLDESFRRYADRVAYKFMGKAISFAQVDDASRALARVAAGPGPGEGRPRRHHDAQRAAVPSGRRRDPARRATSSSTSIRCTRRASSSTS